MLSKNQLLNIQELYRYGVGTYRRSTVVPVPERRRLSLRPDTAQVIPTTNGSLSGPCHFAVSYVPLLHY
jgi:hypothetical protein